MDNIGNQKLEDDYEDGIEKIFEKVTHVRGEGKQDIAKAESHWVGTNHCFSKANPVLTIRGCF